MTKQFHIEFSKVEASRGRPMALFARVERDGLQADFVLSRRRAWRPDDELLRTELGMSDGDIRPATEREALDALTTWLGNARAARRIIAELDSAFDTSLAIAEDAHPLNTRKGSVLDTIRVASEAHGNQLAAGGEMMIEHLFSVMRAVSSDSAKIVALLHHALTETSITLQDLTAAGYSTVEIEAVEHITRREGESLEQWTARIKQSPLATEVKRAELDVSMREPRLDRIPEPRQSELRDEYQRSLKLLDGRTV